MKALLVFPPGWNPCSPYLALPVLKSYLHEYGIAVSINDLNVNFFDYILTKEYLTKCLNKNDIIYTSNTVKNTIEMFRDCVDEIDYAKTTMRSHAYLDPTTRKHVDTIFSNALYIINNTCPDLKISFNSMELHYNRNSSKCVYQACYDDVANPYIGYYGAEVIPSLQKEEYEFIGLSITGHTQLIPALTLCRMIKENCPSVKHITLGGNYITRAADKICNCGFFNKGFFDSISLFDGEISCTELLKVLENNEPLDNAHNIIYIKDGIAIHTPFLKNNTINNSTPDFTGFPLDKYFAPSIILPIFTSRSCYNKCAFCTIPNATSGSYKTMLISDVIKNIQTLQERYNAKFFTIVDETFDIKRMLKLADALIEAKLNIYWYCETRFSEGITQERCARLYQSGCRQVQFGLESYNQRVLDKMAKNIKIEWIDEAIVNCILSGISVHMFFFTGFPTETIEEALRTYDYTSAKVTESQLKYNIIASRGYGTFGLEEGSSVWLNPKEFGVTLIENGPENDLRLNVDYEVSNGLSQKDSEQLVSSQNLRDGIRWQESDDYELPRMDFVPEVHMVVKAAIMPGVEEHRIKIMCSSERIIYSIENNTIKVPCNINISLLSDKVLLYNRYLNQAYTFPKKILRSKLSHDSFYFDNVFASRDNEVIRYLSELIYFGFMITDGLPDESVKDWEMLKLLKPNTLKTYYNDVLKEWVMFNRITNNAVAVNELSYKLLNIFLEPISFVDVYKLLLDNSINISRIRLYELVNYYLKHDMLYALG